jgi:glycosyltransferase involved in cell wall biosynthesis
MACGCPVVTSNRGAQYEVTGACAVHCDPEDVVSIADAIQKTNSDDTLRARLITDGVRWAESFSWDRYAEQLLNIIEHSLNRRTEGTMPGHPASCRVG